MRLKRFCQPGLALGLAVLAILSCAPQASAQDRPQVEIVPNIPHFGGVSAVAFSADGARVLSGSDDRTLKLWDAATGALIRTFEGHSDVVLSVAFSADGARVLSGSDDKTLKLWDAATGAQFCNERCRLRTGNACARTGS